MGGNGSGVGINGPSGSTSGGEMIGTFVISGSYPQREPAERTAHPLPDNAAASSSFVMEERPWMSASWAFW
jgi:hypothetical protein